MSTMRRASLVMCLVLLAQYLLGIGVNLFVPNLPKQDHGASGGVAFVRAVANGPVGLSIHAALGLVLIVVGVGLAVRAGATRRWGLLTLAIVGFLSIAAAAVSGARFVGTGSNGASMGMATSSASAFATYLVMMFLTLRNVSEPHLR
jgi:hypothetical protein